jgi:zinc/manganese transport system permease protein
MNNLLVYLGQPFGQNALLAAALVAIICGLIGPFVIRRNMAFAVHGISELAFTGAAAGLLLLSNPLAGALIGALIVAIAIGLLGVKEKERDSSIGVILAFGLGLGVWLLSMYRGFATAATNILFGNVYGVSATQLSVLIAIFVVVITGLVIMYRPLQFASVDPEVAAARGVPVRGIGIAFLMLLALTVTAAAQIVGTLLVLSLAITPAAAAIRLSARPAIVATWSVMFALIAGAGGVLLSLASGTVKPSVFVTSLSFAIYMLVRFIIVPLKTK